jgi:hypothetical protein
MEDLYSGSHRFLNFNLASNRTDKRVLSSDFVHYVKDNKGDCFLESGWFKGDRSSESYYMWDQERRVHGLA